MHLQRRLNGQLQVAAQPQALVIACYSYCLYAVLEAFGAKELWAIKRRGWLITTTNKRV